MAPPSPAWRGEVTVVGHGGPARAQLPNSRTCGRAWPGAAPPPAGAATAAAASAMAEHGESERRPRSPARAHNSRSRAGPLVKDQREECGAADVG